MNVRHRSLRRAMAGGAASLLVALAVMPISTASGAGDSEPDDGAKAKRIAPLMQPSIVYAEVTWSGYVYESAPQIRKYLNDSTAFTVTTQCTGYVVNPDGWIATAGHCVDPQQGKEAVKRAAAQWAINNNFYSQSYTVEELVGPNDTFRVDILDGDNSVVRNRASRSVAVAWGTSVSGTELAKSKAARVSDFQPFSSGDGALLKVDEDGLNAALLAPADTEVPISEPVVAIGFPAVIESYTDPDLTPTFNQGAVTSTKTVGNELLPVYQVSASLSGGMSGGPTVDDKGRVIGTNSSAFQGESFNYVIPSELILEMLAGAGIENELSETTELYRTGINAYFDGDKKRAVDSLKKVVDEQPGNAIAEDYLEKAKDLPDPKPKDEGGSRWWL
ncbi:MAG: S1 family peptidase, partial [Nocardioides sp.]